MLLINEAECEAAGLDIKEVKRIAKGLTRYAEQAEALGITVFGGAASGQLHFDDNGTGEESLVVAALGGRFDGGAGSTSLDENGLLRSE
jgi:flagellin-like hook-associated protein FlgL